MLLLFSGRTLPAGQGIFQMDPEGAADARLAFYLKAAAREIEGNPKLDEAFELGRKV